MDVLTDYVLGADVMVLILITGALAVAALVVGLLPARRAEPPGVEDRRVQRSLLTAMLTVTAWTALPIAGLLLLVPATAQDRALRSGMLLAGAAVVLLAVSRALPLARAGAAARGALVGLGLAAVPLVPTLAVLRHTAADALLGLTAGGALAAGAVHAVTALADVTGRAGALLAGTAEQGIAADDAENPAAHLRERGTRMRTAARAADCAALTMLVVGATAVTAVPVLAAEGLILALLGLAVALGVALLAALLPLREGAVRTLGPAVLGGVGLVVGAALWLPGSYASLRFDPVGMGSFTDPAIAGAEPVPRADFVQQLEATQSTLEEFVSATDESRNASAFLDVLALYEVSPAVVAACAAGLGALAALAAALIAASAAAPSGAAVRAAARTSRTGGALGLAAAGAAVALRGAAVLGLLALAAGALGVLGAGVPQLVLALATIAGLGALAVMVGMDAGADGGRPAGRAAALTARTTVVLLGGLGLLSPLLALITAAGRATTVWEDRAVHAMTPGSGLVIGAAVLAAMVIALQVGAVLEGSRRLGAESVVSTRTAVMDDLPRAHMDALGVDARRTALVVVVGAGALALLGGFGAGPGALPVLVTTALVVAVALAVLAILLEAVLDAALELIESGRYGGAGGWAHTGALSNAVLAASLRGAVPGALWGAVQTAALVVLAGPTMLGLVLDGTDPLLRWGIALIAALIWLGCWVHLLVSVQPDLEDQVAEH